MRRLWVSFLIVLLVGVLVGWVQIPVVKAQSWLPGWSYRKSHEIANRTGSGSNYQVNMTVYYGSGSDSGSSVYLDSKCQTDFDDVRFTDNDGTTLLDAWDQSVSDSTSLTCWVEVADSLESANVTIYIYYGNSTVSSYWDGYATFPFYEHFPGSSLNGTSWTSSGSPAVSSSELTVDRVGVDEGVKGTTDFGSNYKLVSRAKVTADVAYLNLHGGQDTNDGSDMAVVRRESAGWRTFTRNGVSTELQSISTPTLNTYYIWSVNYDSSYVKFFRDGSLLTTHSTQVPNEDLASVYDAQGATGTKSIVSDWNFIAKWVESEPVHGGWGSEETSGLDLELMVSRRYVMEGFLLGLVFFVVVLMVVGRKV